ncbi:hypothetical protein M231_00480 [Tremella mesenterica]|uniref:N-acetyltransferase domain-containing protein n=1 Tax=Tremella mesenterica TaxID=5217 RepID=A0A4Q1BVF3_TREME|nr:hypothetical protein M231_00480 [Tremella mesenterica]
MLNQIPSDVIPLKELMVVMAKGKQEEEHLYECWLTWGCGLTLQEFTDVAHEEMTTSGWAQNHGDTVWALVRRSDPQGSILSACETHRTRGFLKQKGGNKVENAWYYGMTCVVTPAQHQRKGYATHLLRLMHYILASPLHLPTFPSEWGSPPSPIPIELEEYFPPAWGTFLSSEIGPDFYYRCLVGIDRRGWEAKEVWQEEVEWEILSSSRLSIPSDPSKSSPILARSESIYHAALPNPSEVGEIKCRPLENHHTRSYRPCCLTLMEWDEPIHTRSLESDSPLPVSVPTRKGVVCGKKPNWEIIYDHHIPSISTMLSRSTREKVEQADSCLNSVFCPDPASEGTSTFAAVRGAYGPQPRWRKFPQPLGIRLRSESSKIAHTSHDHDYDEDSKSGNKPDDIRSPKQENEEQEEKYVNGKEDREEGEEVKEEDTIILFSLLNPQIEDKLLITYIHNLPPELVKSAVEKLDEVVRDQGMDVKYGTVWGLDPTSEVVQAWAALGERNIGKESKISFKDKVRDDDKEEEREKFKDENEVHEPDENIADADSPREERKLRREVKVKRRKGGKAHLYNWCWYVDGETKVLDSQMWIWL